MAVKACKECGDKVSSKAKTCPHCGVSNPGVRASDQAVGCMVLIVIAVGVILYINNHNSSNTGNNTRQSSSPTKQHNNANPSSGNAAADPETEEDQEKFAIGDSIRVGVTSYQVREAWRQAIDGRIWDQERSKGLDGDGQYLFIRVVVANRDTKPRQIPKFELVDGRGARYEQSGEALMRSENFGLFETLNPDSAKEGTISFFAPKGRGYDLKVSGGFWSSAVGYIEIEPNDAGSE